MKYLEGLNKIIEAMGKRELDQNAQQTTYLGLIAMQLATMNDELARMNGSVKSEVHCACTDEEISKSFMEDVSAIEKQLPKQSDDEIIHVGDEIERIKGNHDRKYIVTRIIESDYINIIFDDGGVGYVNPIHYRKTGRHFPQIEEVLKQLQEGKE